MDEIEKILNKAAIINATHFHALCEWDCDAKLAANYIINNMMSEMKSRNLEWKTCPVTPLMMKDLLWFIHHELIPSTIGKQILIEMFDTGRYAFQIILEKDLWQVNDDGHITSTIDKILADNTDKVEQYRSGKTKLLGFFVGQAMKQFAGKVDATKINELLKERLA